MSAKNYYKQPKAMQNVTFKNNLVYTEDEVPVKTLYIGNLKPNHREYQLRNYFVELGPIESLKIHEKKDHIFGFVTFSKYEDAAKVLQLKHHTVNGTKLRIRPADSWHQPKKKDNAVEVAATNTANNVDEALAGSSGSTEAGNSSVSLLCLNDDCLLHVLSFLDIVEMVRLRGICGRLDELIDMACAKHKQNFDFSSIAKYESITLMTARNLLTYLGPDLKSLKIDCDDFNNNSGFRLLDFIARYCKSLENLDIDGFTINQKQISRLTPMFRNLKKFSAGAKGRFNDSIGKCFEVANNIDTVTMCSNWEVTGEFLKKISNLQRLGLNRCGNVQPKFFIQALQKNRTLKALEIQCCDKFDDRVLNTMVADLKELEELTISNSYEKMQHFEKFAELVSLKRLTVEFHSLTPIERLLEKLAERNQLTEFNYVGSGAGVSKRTVDLISKLTNLRVLSIAFNQLLSDVSLKGFSALSNLESLAIPGACSITPTAILQLVQDCEKLCYLDVSQTEVNANDFVFKLIDILQKSHSRPVLEVVVFNSKVEEAIAKHEKVVKNQHLIKLSFDQRLERSNLFMEYLEEDEEYIDSDDDFFDMLVDDDYDLDGEDLFDFDINEQWGFFDSDDDKYMLGWGNINTPSPPDHW